MRTPLNRLHRFLETYTMMPQPMLKRSRTFRYDPPVLADFEWPAGELVEVPEEQESDMDVSGTGAVGGPGPIRPAQLAPAQGPATALPSGLEAPQDEVQISSAARALEQLQHDPAIREARLAEIRAAIADGTYETPAKLEAALEKLIERIGSEGI